MKKLLSVLLICIFLVVFVLAGCGTSSNKTKSGTDQTQTQTQPNTDEKASDENKEPVNLTVMYQNNGETNQYKKWMDKNIELFMQENSNIKIESVCTVSGDQYLTKVTTDMAANAMEDIFEGWVLERIAPFVKAGRIYEIGQELDKDKEFKDFLNEQALESTTFDGKVYAIPSTMQGEYIDYNKDVFAKLNLQEPKTYDDFLNIIKVCKQNGIIPIVLCNKEAWTGSILYTTIFDRIAGTGEYENAIIKRSGKFTDKSFVDSANVLQEWIKLGAFENGVNGISYDDAEAKFVQGKAAMWFIGSFINSVFEQKMGKDKVGMFNLPEIPGGKGSKDNWIAIPNQAIAISEKCANKPEAVAFVKYIFSQERQAELAKQGYITCTKVKLDVNELDPLVVKFIESLSTAKAIIYPWDVPLGNSLGQELNNMTQTLYDLADPVKTLTNLQKISESEQKNK